MPPSPESTRRPVRHRLATLAVATSVAALGGVTLNYASRTPPKSEPAPAAVAPVVEAEVASAVASAVATTPTPAKETTPAFIADSTCPRAEDTIEVTGTLARKTFPGPPGYGDSPDDRPETGYYLELAAPICTGPSEFGSTDSTISMIQLAPHDYAPFPPYMGRRITLRGTWFHAHTGHHHARVLLEPIGKIRLARKSR